MRALLSHYFRPEEPAELREAAIVDWLSLLHGLPRDAVNHACQGYLRDQPRRRPAPGEIRQRALGFLEARRSSRPCIGELTPAETAVSNFAVDKGWLSQSEAETAILEARGQQALPWLVSETDVALHAVRHSPQNRKIDDRENGPFPTAKEGARFRR